MRGATERTFLTSLLALPGAPTPGPTISTALEALMTLAGARYARVEVRLLGADTPVVLVEPVPRPPDLLEQGLRERFELEDALVQLDLYKAEPPTYYEREQFGHFFDALLRLASSLTAGETSTRSFREATQAFQVRLVEEALRRAKGNVSHAARELQVTRTFIYKCMRVAAARKRRDPATFRGSRRG